MKDRNPVVYSGVYTTLAELPQAKHDARTSFAPCR